MDGSSILPASTTQASLTGSFKVGSIGSKLPSVSTPIQGYIINNKITAQKLRVVDAEGGNLGVLSRDEALEKAQAEGLDLILIVPNASPPVARIISFDKFRYQKEKEFKKQRQQKALELKQIQISVREARNDLLTKLKKIEKFLGAGHKVEITMTLRGREKGLQGWARAKLQEFLQSIPVPYKVTQDVQRGGRGLVTQIDKDNSSPVSQEQQLPTAQ